MAFLWTEFVVYELISLILMGGVAWIAPIGMHPWGIFKGGAIFVGAQMILFLALWLGIAISGEMVWYQLTEKVRSSMVKSFLFLTVFLVFAEWLLGMFVVALWNAPIP